MSISNQKYLTKRDRNGGFNNAGLGWDFGINDGQEVTPKKPITYTDIRSIDIDADSCVSFQLKFNSGEYLYFEGNSWVQATNSNHTSTGDALSKNITKFVDQFGPGQLFIKAILENSGNQDTNCTINDVNVLFK